VLRSATAEPRRHFGDPQPLLAIGAAFDAVLLAQSPFAELAAVRQPQMVWRGGATRSTASHPQD
jgi:hypothetical protein